MQVNIEGMSHKDKMNELETSEQINTLIWYTSLKMKSSSIWVIEAH
jgi:hypothetical protein